jgi:hypothetical protein
MAHININKRKVTEKWSPIVEKLGVTDPSKKEWIAEYAEYHSINENVAYAQGVNVTGMGAVVSSQPSGIPGQTGYGTGMAGDAFGQGGSVGSGDYGQQLLPIAMKVAAHTIGLDLVAVKPSPGPVIDLMYVDYRYDDGATDHTDNYNPVVFKISGADSVGTSLTTTLTTQIRTIMSQLGVREIQGGLNQRMFFNLAANSSGVTGITVNPTINGVTYADGSGIRAKGSIGTGLADCLVEPTGSKEGVIEFLGFSRIDKSPMFKAYRTTNTTPQGVYKFDRTKNTFGEIEAVKDAFELTNASNLPLVTNTLGFKGPGTAGHVKIDLISALEDHIFGFVTNNGLHAMTRAQDDRHYAGIIAPNVTTKRVQVGTIEVSSALQLTEIEDIKAQTGIDIVSKLESVLVNELSQTISKEIVFRLFELGDQNRKSAPGYNASLTNGGYTIFDFNVQAYLGTGSGLGTTAPGGETKQSLQRGLITKIKTASNFIATEGRVGPASYIVTNGLLAAVLTEGMNYELNKETGSSSAAGQLYPAGKVAGITIYVDPYQYFNDNRILLGRKNNPDQPGVVFVPYLMAQSVKLISEATFAPRMLLRSRYAVTEVGFFPQKQYMTLYVNDPQNYLA